jgi:hypothetical protein
MGGGVIQLVTRGKQSHFLVGTDGASYYRSVIHRKTNFAIESIQQTISGIADFGNTFTVTLARGGDLITECMLQVTLPDVPYTVGSNGAAWVKDIGHILIEEIKVEIGNTCIDKQYGEWMSIWTELTIPSEKYTAYQNMIGSTSDLIGTRSCLIHHINPIPGKELYIPLKFWFNKSPGTALPLIALQFNEVKFRIQFRNAADLLRGNPTNPSQLHLKNVKFYTDFVFLEKDERELFAKTTRKLIVTQLQRHKISVNKQKNNIIRVNFNHPIKELIWTAIDTERQKRTDIYRDYVNFRDSTDRNPFIQSKILINNIDRFSERTSRYFNMVQPMKHHTRVPAGGINMYSFGLYPESIDPSGTLDFSVVEDAVLETELSDAAALSTSIITIYAVNYNVLTVERGMAAVMFNI